MIDERERMKPFYEKWWFWLLATIIVLTLINNRSSNEPDKEETKFAEETASLMEPAPKTKADEKDLQKNIAFNNPILSVDPEAAEKAIKERAEAEWKDDYVMQDAEVEDQTKAYKALKEYAIDTEIKQTQIEKAVKEWGTDFVMVQFQYDEQVTAYEDLQEYTLDTKVKKTQMKKALDEWGDDYVMVKYQFDQQMAAYNN